MLVSSRLSHFSRLAGPLLLFVGGCVDLEYGSAASAFDEDITQASLDALYAAAPDLPPPSSVKYESALSATGTGCPEGTVTSRLSNDATTAYIKFSKFLISVAEPKSVATANCSVSMKISVPTGYSFGVTSHRYTINSIVDPAVHDARFLVSYGYTGQGQESAPWYAITESGSIEPPTEVKHAMHSDCGRERVLNIDLTLFLRNTSDREAYGQLQMSIANFESGGSTLREGETAVKLALDWKRCP